MYIKRKTSAFTANYSEQMKRLKEALAWFDTVVIGAGAGLSASAGFTYSGPRFEKHFGDFIGRYHYPDMYTAGFYPYETPEEYWAYWSRHIYYNRFVPAPEPVYDALRALVQGKDYFVLTTNVDHCFQKAGFDRNRLFYTQGDYGLWQCSRPCRPLTYDNEEAVRRMLAEQKNRLIPAGLVPRCPVCGAAMTMNLRCDTRFVEDAGWHKAKRRYEEFLALHRASPALYLELGVGLNTPGIIKLPFWRLTAQNENSIYACVNLEEAMTPDEIADRSICIRADIGSVLHELTASKADG